MALTLKQITEAVRSTRDARDWSYVKAYRHFIDFFQSKETIDEQSLVVGAHCAYGWMPTMLELNEQDDQFQGTLEIIAKVKDRQVISTEELANVGKTINNSLVGASKLLHFVNPDDYPIWDSRVYRYWANERPYGYRMSASAYLAYRQNCEDISREPRFSSIHKEVNKKMGYDVTAMRAIEWIAYVNGGS